MIDIIDKERLENIYERYNRREFAHPDPLEFLYNYDNPGDIEIAGLMASSLAYGRVAQILKKTSEILDIMGPHPSIFLKKASDKFLCEAFSGFVSNAHFAITSDNIQKRLDSGV